MRNSRRAGKPAGKKPEKQGLLGLFTKGKNIPTTAQQTLLTGKCTGTECAG